MNNSSFNDGLTEQALHAIAKRISEHNASLNVRESANIFTGQVLSFGQFNQAQFELLATFNQEKDVENDKQGIPANADFGVNGERESAVEVDGGARGVTDLSGITIRNANDPIRVLDEAGLQEVGGAGHSVRSDSLALVENEAQADEFGFDFSLPTFEPEVKPTSQESNQEKERESSSIATEDFGFDFDAPINNEEVAQEESYPADSLKSAKLSPKTRFNANLDAIKLVLSKEASGEPYTDEERKTLAGYTGFGSLSSAFSYDSKFTPQWEKEGVALESLLTDAQYTKLRQSALNAYYTPDAITNAVWSGLKSAGFHGGRVLEPACGTGAFISALEKEDLSIFKRTKFSAVEYDDLTASIAKGIFSDKPNVSIIHKGFEQFDAPKGSYDVVVMNPPFGKDRVHDARNPHLNQQTIHNYFMTRAVEQLKPGGIMVAVVSHYFMDSKDLKAKTMIAEQARLVGGFRTPDNTFNESGAQVETDILIFQKALEGEVITDKGWVDTYNFASGATMSCYFYYNPRFILGQLEEDTDRFNKPVFVVRDNGVFNGAFLKALMEDTLLGDQVVAGHFLNQSIQDSLTDNAINDATSSHVFEVDESIVEYASAYSIGEHFIYNDEIYLKTYFKELDSGETVGQPYEKIDYKINSKDKRVALKDGEVARLKGMIELSALVNNLRKMQIDKQANDTDIEVLRKSLNNAYDRFVKAFGYLHGQTNSALFRDDLNAPLLLSLEDDYDKGVSAAKIKELGVKPRKATAEKADIFHRRTQYPYSEPTSAENEEDALTISLSQKGCVDMNYIAKLVGKEKWGVVEYLQGSGQVFLDDTQAKPTYVHRDAFLSGNVRHKYNHTKIEENKSALKEALPQWLSFEDISVQLGASFVREQDYRAFIKEIAGNEPKDFVCHSYNSQYEVVVQSTELARAQYGTRRVNPEVFIERLLNNKAIQVFDAVDDGDGKKRSVLNKSETMLAVQKADEILMRWKDWIYEDKERQEYIEKTYNELFNVYTETVSDGSHLKLPGKVDDSVFELRPHQKNAAWRAIQGQPTLFDHTVGTGKTATTVISAMEMRRTGRAKKPLIVVPNHLVQQWSKEFLALYPNAHILAPDGKDFEKKRRRVLFNRMMTGDYDAIIIGHSQLMKIKNSESVERDLILNEKYLLEEVLHNTTKSKNTRFIETRLKNLDTKLQGLLNADNRDDISFDEIGIDALFVDEAHEFKNLTYQTGMTGVSGLGSPAGSKKAFDLFVKSRSLLERTEGKNLVFLTGTPISNSIAEMYSMMRYLGDYSPPVA